MTAAHGDWLRLGTLTAPWGIRGEVKIRLDADMELVERLTRVYLGAEHRPFEVTGVFKRGRFATLKFRGVNDANAVEPLRDLIVEIPRAEAPPLSEGQYFVEDIVGLRVLTTAGRDLGRVAEVIATGANDVYLVRGEASEILIPAIESVVVAIDPEAGEIRIEPMPGLLPDA